MWENCSIYKEWGKRATQSRNKLGREIISSRVLRVDWKWLQLTISHLKKSQLNTFLYNFSQRTTWHDIFVSVVLFPFHLQFLLSLASNSKVEPFCNDRQVSLCILWKEITLVRFYKSKASPTVYYLTEHWITWSRSDLYLNKKYIILDWVVGKHLSLLL